MQNNQYINQFFQFRNSGGKLDMFVQMFAKQYPEFNEMYNFMKNQSQSNNVSMKDIAMNMAKERGIDPAFLQDMANKMGN